MGGRECVNKSMDWVSRKLSVFVDCCDRHYLEFGTRVVYTCSTYILYMCKHTIHAGAFCRYDIRNRLEDKGQFGLKPNLPRRRTQAEEEGDEALDHERYLGLGVDVLEHELMEGTVRVGHE